MRVFPSAAAVAALLAVTASYSLGQATTEPDPAELLRRSIETLAEAPAASVDFLAETTLVRDDRKDITGSAFRYRTAPAGRFEFVSSTEDGSEPNRGYRVVGNGRVTLTQLISQRRHMLAEDNGGFAAFVRSPSAASIGSGLGNLALSPLSPDTGEELAANIESSEYLGVVDVEGEALHHARYTVTGGLTFDAWFTADDRSLIRRLVPDLSDDPGVVQLSRKYDNFEYVQSFEFSNWEISADTEAEITVVEPRNSILQASLYRRPPQPPYHLLGKPAPAFELAKPDGERVSLADRGEDKVVMLEFWSMGCPICIQAMPELEELEKRYASRGLKYYPVNLGEEPSDVAAFLEARGLSPETLIDTSGEVGDEYRVGPIPMILLIGKQGKVQAVQLGFAPGAADRLAGQIEGLLEGEELSEKALTGWREEQARQTAERDRLRSLLDG